jgi:flagellar L-ring protein FlgH
MMMKRFLLCTLAIMVVVPAYAENLYVHNNWPALAADRRPERVGDTITIIVAENQQASNTVRKGSKKRSAIDGQIFAGKSFDKSAGGNFGGSYDGEGTNARADRVVAQLSATVYGVEPNGDLRVSGWQSLNINGEATRIKVSGRIRREDITGNNTIASSRLADAIIDYDGQGFASRSAKPGAVTKIFNWLGIL